MSPQGLLGLAVGSLILAFGAYAWHLLGRIRDLEARLDDVTGKD